MAKQITNNNTFKKEKEKKRKEKKKEKKKRKRFIQLEQGQSALDLVNNRW